MNYTDNELKQLLAKMLPEDVFFTADGIDFNWSNASENCPKERRGCNVFDTELLFLCSLARKRHELKSSLTADATWQEQVQELLTETGELYRTTALAETKGVSS